MTFEKPSARMGRSIEAQALAAEREYRRALERAQGPMPDARWLEIREYPYIVKVITERLNDFAANAICEELDREAERRAAWEAKVEAFARAQGVEL